MCRYEEGDVIHYTHLSGGIKEIDAWVLTTDGYGKCVLLKGWFYAHRERPGQTCSIGDSDPGQQGRRVVPPEEWPDDITIMMARYKLTGELKV